MSHNIKRLATIVMIKLSMIYKDDTRKMKTAATSASYFPPSLFFWVKAVTWGFSANQTGPNQTHFPYRLVVLTLVAILNIFDRFLIEFSGL